MTRIRKATERRINAVWTLTFRFEHITVSGQPTDDVKGIPVVRIYGWDNRDDEGYLDEHTLPRVTPIENSDRKIIGVRFEPAPGSDHLPDDYPLGCVRSARGWVFMVVNPAHVFSYGQGAQPLRTDERLVLKSIDDVRASDAKDLTEWNSLSLAHQHARREYGLDPERWAAAVRSLFDGGLLEEKNGKGVGEAVFVRFTGPGILSFAMDNGTATFTKP